MAQRYVVAAASEIAAGERKIVTAGGRAIAVFNVNGSFHALANTCPHLGGSLGDGFVTGIALSSGPNDYRIERKGEFIRCPWHGWEFDIATGQSWCDPGSLRARQFSVKVEHGEELVKGPYVAESFPVKVEDDYVIVEI